MKDRLPKQVHMVGIGGIGMSALAQLLVDRGVVVSGSDRDISPVTELLELKGIEVHIGQKAENIPEAAELIIYTEAVFGDNPERMEGARRNLPERSYFAMLGEVSKGMRTLAVSGTHGKTTTTGMTARILRDASVSPTAIVGSLVRDFGSNYLRGTSNLFVVEACEYKRDFMTLNPEILVITNIEFDHTDYYRDLEDVQSAFAAFIEKVPAHGAIVTDATHPNIAPLLQNVAAKVIDYKHEPAYELTLPGEFNRMNARAAAAAARAVASSITDEHIRISLEAFEGTWRRFEYKGVTSAGAAVYDDYAHHPTAVKHTLAELRKKTTGKIFIAFHPHLYSRTRDLLEDFSTAFSDADEVVIAPIYAAREVDDGSISNSILAERISESGTYAHALDSFDGIEHYLYEHAKEGDAIMTMGAGDIYKVADALMKKP